VFFELDSFAKVLHEIVKKLFEENVKIEIEDEFSVFTESFSKTTVPIVGVSSSEFRTTRTFPLMLTTFPYGVEAIEEVVRRMTNERNAFTGTNECDNGPLYSRRKTW